MLASRSLKLCMLLIFYFRVDTCTNYLPEKKPRYVMGVGYPEDLVVSVALGADMFDCVWPSRTAVRDSVSVLNETMFGYGS